MERKVFKFCVLMLTMLVTLPVSFVGAEADQDKFYNPYDKYEILSEEYNNMISDLFEGDAEPAEINLDFNAIAKIKLSQEEEGQLFEAPIEAAIEGSIKVQGQDSMRLKSEQYIDIAGERETSEFELEMSPGGEEDTAAMSIKFTQEGKTIFNSTMEMGMDDITSSFPGAESMPENMEDFEFNEHQFEYRLVEEDDEGFTAMVAFPMSLLEDQSKEVGNGINLENIYIPVYFEFKFDGADGVELFKLHLGDDILVENINYALEDMAFEESGEDFNVIVEEFGFTAENFGVGDPTVFEDLADNVD